MVVYRVCSKDELFKILDSRDFYNVGRYIERNVGTMNNHKYQKGKRYLHFFKEKISILNLDVQNDSYVCTYIIPDKILFEYEGKGYYYNIELVTFAVTEYAIPTDLLNISNFLCYETFNSTKILNNKRMKKIKVK